MLLKYKEIIKDYLYTLWQLKKSYFSISKSHQLLSHYFNIYSTASIAFLRNPLVKLKLLKQHMKFQCGKIEQFWKEQLYRKENRTRYFLGLVVLFFTSFHMLTASNPFRNLLLGDILPPIIQETQQLVTLYTQSRYQEELVPIKTSLTLTNKYIIQQRLRILAAALTHPKHLQIYSQQNFIQLEALPKFDYAIMHIWYIDDQLLVLMNSNILQSEYKYFRKKANASQPAKWYYDIFFKAWLVNIFSHEKQIQRVRFSFTAQKENKKNTSDGRSAVTRKRDLKYLQDNWEKEHKPNDS